MPPKPTNTYESLEDLVKENLQIEVYETIFDHLVKYFNENYEPESVFDEDKLEAWAEDNGYIKDTSDAIKE